MTPKLHVLTGLTTVIALQLVALPSARANCAIFSFYASVEEETGSVVVCADGRSCLDGDVMLRENVETGEVVELDGGCRDGEWDSCWVDDCVPAGTYRYGTVEPLQCGCGSRDIFTEIELTTTRQSCEPRVRPYDDGAPWGDESSEECVAGCSAVASDPSHVGFPAFVLVGLVGLALMALRRRGA